MFAPPARACGLDANARQGKDKNSDWQHRPQYITRDTSDDYPTWVCLRHSKATTKTLLPTQYHHRRRHRVSQFSQQTREEKHNQGLNGYSRPSLPLTPGLVVPVVIAAILLRGETDPQPRCRHRASDQERARLVNPLVPSRPNLYHTFCPDRDQGQRLHSIPAICLPLFENCYLY